MRCNFLPLLTVGLIAVGVVGCENRPSTPGPGGTRVDVDATPDGGPRRDINVNTGPGGVGVEIDSNGKRPLDVDVSPGGVKVDVDGEAIRERVQERRTERALEKAADKP